MMKTGSDERLVGRHVLLLHPGDDRVTPATRGRKPSQHALGQHIRRYWWFPTAFPVNAVRLGVILVRDWWRLLGDNHKLREGM